ncbi:hypothetical protein [Empedobacter sp. UBA5637]|uniref:hypothetical protein n=1 Tax=Empedobacter sp. UBA5637 TaxID=1946442 RepID=UPI0025BC3093|nr:hypothetical protein [Empedobacter sp. UBA5637]
MVDIKRLYEFGLEIKASNIGINHFRMVDGPDKLVESLKDLTNEENHVLIIVLPSHSSNGSTSFDDLDYNNFTQFLVLEKFDIRTIENNYEEMMVFHRTLETLKKLIDKMKNDFYEREEFCGLMSSINMGSLQIDPVRHQSETSGYSLVFTF